MTRLPPDQYIDTVRALHDYPAPDPTCLSLSRGDIIYVHSKDASGWWDGTIGSQRGWFPSNYIEPVQDPSALTSPGQGSESGAPQSARDRSNSLVNAHMQLDSLAQTLEEVLSDKQAFPDSGSSSNEALPESAGGHGAAKTGEEADEAREGPAGLEAFQQTRGDLPPYWVRKVNPTNGQVYYVNTQTSESTYEMEDVRKSASISRRRSLLLLQDDKFVANQDKSLPPNRPQTATAGGTFTSDWGLASLLTETTDISWELLINNILKSISDLNYSAKNQIKSRYVEQTHQIVRAIRDMFASSGTISSDAEIMRSNPKLATHHTGIMSNLSKLILSAKLASGIWPPPDSANTMRYQAGQVLLAVRHFVAVAQDLAIALRHAPEEQMALFDLTGIALADQELVSRIETYTKGIMDRLATTVTLITQSRNVVGNDLVNSVRECVTSIGELMSIIEDVRVDVSPLEDPNQLVSQLVSSKERLYMFATDLVALVSSSANRPFSSGAETVNQLLEATTHVITSVENVVIAVKLVIDRRDELEWHPISEQTSAGSGGRRPSASNELSNLQRRALSLTFLVDGSNGGDQHSRQMSASMSGGLSSAGSQQPQQRYVEPNTAPAAMGITNSLNRALSDAGNRPLSSGSSGLGSHVSPYAGGSGMSGNNANANMINSNNSSAQPGRSPTSPLADRKFSVASGYSFNGPTSAGSYQQHIQHQIPHHMHQQPMSVTGSYYEASNAGSAHTGDHYHHHQQQHLQQQSQYETDDSQQSPAEISANKLRKFFGDGEIPKRMGPRSKNDGTKGLNFLAKDYRTEDITFNMEGAVNGGTFEALVERLTLHDQPVDAGFANAFLMTFHLFATSEDLLNVLINRYNLSPPQGLSDAELKIWIDKKLVPIQIRVSNAFKTWLESHWVDALDDVCLDRIYQFASNVMMRAHAPLASRLMELVTKKINTDVMQTPQTPKIKRANVRPEDIPQPVLPRNLKRFSLLDLDPIEVARQMTLIESAMYARIMPQELMRQEWAKKRGSIANNVRAMSQMSTKVTGWVVSSILSDSDAKRRSIIIKFFIKVADRCLAYNNYNTLFAILAGLDSTTIARLRRSWEGQSAKTQAMFDYLKRIADHNRNYAEYRQRLRQSPVPTLPFIGLFLTDLTFTDDGNPDRRNNGRLINFDKYAKTARIIQEVQRFQIGFVYVDVPEIQDFLIGSIEREGRRDAQELYEISLALEPREMDATSGGASSVGDDPVKDMQSKIEMLKKAGLF
ncbi:ras guanine nucleotide exchange factor domain-containing protein [Entophlyctis helioformis]|nr:ras guanine nucleotide exchange factor domain-containing protein [Entophlyctis helioformis]